MALDGQVLIILGRSGAVTVWMLVGVVRASKQGHIVLLGVCNSLFTPPPPGLPFLIISCAQEPSSGSIME